MLEDVTEVPESRNDSTDGYEYGIRYCRPDPDGGGHKLHRDQMTREQAETFMDPTEWDGADPTRMFEVVRRPIGEWQRLDGTED